MAIKMVLVVAAAKSEELHDGDGSKAEKTISTQNADQDNRSDIIGHGTPGEGSSRAVFLYH